MLAEPHMEKCRSLVSMLRCLIHIRVRAEPMSLVPPGKNKNIKKHTWERTQALNYSRLREYFCFRVIFGNDRTTHNCGTYHLKLRTCLIFNVPMLKGSCCTHVHLFIYFLSLFFAMTFFLCLCHFWKSHWNGLYKYIFFLNLAIGLCCEKET